jgi:BlaI family penicillinase repressor
MGEATVAEVASRIPDRPTYNSVRVTLGILERKGHVRHRRDGRRYVYWPTVPHEEASRSAARELLKTFFSTSPSKAVLTMLDLSEPRLTERELEEIAGWIERARASEDEEPGA